MNLEFYVLTCDLNTDKPVMYNIFNNLSVLQSLELVKKDNLNINELEKRLNSIFMSVYWSRYEYEIEVKPKFSKKDSTPTDVYEQIKPNLKLITKMVYKYFEGGGNCSEV